MNRLTKEYKTTYDFPPKCPSYQEVCTYHDSKGTYTYNGQVCEYLHNRKTCTIKECIQKRRYIPVNVLASSLSILVPSLVDTQVKCRGSTSRSPVRDVKLPSAAVQLLTFPLPNREKGRVL